MPVTITKYGNIGKHLANAEINYLTDSITVFLLLASYIPDFDADEFQDDLVLASNEIASTSTYVAGTGIDLATKSITYDGTNHYTKFGAADLSILASTIPAVRYAAIVDTQSGVNTTNPLIALVDFGTDQLTANEEFKIAWDANGVFAL